ncbi:glutathione S-transferase T3-like [Brassica napus]|uniref:glutathione S-transferase T3-like n=1 Tax=Brassica napus TaxID=3708 RepID=UPI002079914F|nr:glutathione S-transferase T3-like [Brassica napus]
MDGFTNLLHSQIPIDLESPEPYWFGSEVPAQSAERRKYSPREDKILIGAWLNTSKDPIIGNEQRVGAFWKRIVEYYNASPLLVGQTAREITSCKQRWSRINGEVCRFTGCYDAALRAQKSGENDDDLMKAALDIFFTKYGYKFTLDHCWRELRHDQKWASIYVAKEGGKEKRRSVLEVDTEEADVGDPEERPIGVKAAKGGSKKKKMSGKEEELSKLQNVLELKEKLSKNKLLDRLLAKKEPLSDIETSLKLKLMLGEVVTDV